MQGSLLQKFISMDINGGLLVAGCLSSFVLAMHWVGTMAWGSSHVAGSLAGSCLFAGLFGVNEWMMGTKAVVQPHLLRNRYIIRNCLFAFFLAGAFFPLLYLLPIQFQSIGNQSAAESGIRLIPFVLGVSVFTMVSNGLLTFWKYFNLMFVFGAICATAGASLMYTYGLDSSTGAWIGSEILASAGVGAALQVPLLANYAAVGTDDIPAATSLALFLENVGTTIFVAATDGAFTKGLVHGVATHLPHLNPLSVVNSGVTDVRSKFPGSELPAILEAYLESCKDSHLVPVACGSLAGLIATVSGASVFFTSLPSWVSKPHTG